MTNKIRIFHTKKATPSQTVTKASNTRNVNFALYHNSFANFVTVRVSQREGFGRIPKIGSRKSFVRRTADGSLHAKVQVFRSFQSNAFFLRPSFFIPRSTSQHVFSDRPRALRICMLYIFKRSMSGQSTGLQLAARAV